MRDSCQLKSNCVGGPTDGREQFDTRWMNGALTLARATAGLASPNPQVGCVLVRGGDVLGEGAHRYDEYDHAEIVALKQAAALGLDVDGATAYVTLEPCSHHGRTPPCADALIAARVAKVVVATVDPNPQVSGEGIARLRAAGIEAVVGVCQREARGINDAFAKFIRTRRPLVTLKAALSVDGMLAPAGSARSGRQPFWLTGPEARAEVQQLRHSADAILTGIGTVLADDPALTDRTELARRRRLMRVVLDSQLRLPLDSQLVRTAANDVLVFCASEAEAERASALEASGVEVARIAADSGNLDLAEVLDALGRRKILSVLLECGSALNGTFLRNRLVDKVALFYSQTELGEGALPFANGFASPFLLEQQLRSITRAEFGADACVTGYLGDPWPAAVVADALG
jgi:diaminohydroxyphosphoribosylaminopyrimidine deaminase/5-amino-6-(5-phosphoribosylamino)uracil reductase